MLGNLYKNKRAGCRGGSLSAQRRWGTPASEPFALEYLPCPLARCGGLSRTMTAVTGALLGALMILMHWELLDSHTLTVPSSDPAKDKHHSLGDDAFVMLPCQLERHTPLRYGNHP